MPNAQTRHSACELMRAGANSTNMAEQLRLWGDHDDEPAPLEERAEEYPTPSEPPPETPEPPTSLDRDLNLFYLDYLGRSAERIALSIETNQAERRARYLRLINYEHAVGKLGRKQRDLLREIVWGRQPYG
jgi:hypothetical protein